MAIISQVIVYIMVVFMAIAAIDRMFGSKLGLGDEFEGGFNAMGGLALGMGGIMVTADLIDNHKWDEITALCQQSVAIVKEVRNG